MAVCSHAEPDLIGTDVRCDKCRRPTDPRHYYSQKMGPTKFAHIQFGESLETLEASIPDSKQMVKILARTNRVYWVSPTGVRVHPSAL